MMCLLIGPQGSGKTLFLKRLQNYYFTKDVETIGDAPATLVTVGTNLVDVTLNKKQQITVREIGGSMGPIWFNYYKDCQLLIYMVDMSNRLKIAASCVQFLSCLGHESLQDTNVLILLNKIDLATTMSRYELESLFRMDDILKHCKQNISILEISAFNGKGLDAVLKWLQQHYKHEKES